MALSGRACELVTNISCVDARDVRHLIEKPSDLLLATDTSGDENRGEKR